MSWFNSSDQSSTPDTSEARLALRVREEALEVREHALAEHERAEREQVENLQRRSRQLAERSQAMTSPQQADQAILERLRAVEEAEARLRAEERRLVQWEESLTARSARPAARDAHPAVASQALDMDAVELALDPPTADYLQMSGPAVQAVTHAMEVEPPHGDGSIPEKVRDPGVRTHTLRSDPLHLHLVGEVEQLRQGFAQMRERMRLMSQHTKDLELQLTPKPGPSDGLAEASEAPSAESAAFATSHKWQSGLKLDHSPKFQNSPHG
jgi:hypothetical protein